MITRFFIGVKSCPSKCTNGWHTVYLENLLQRWTPSDIERCLITLGYFKTKTSRFHGSLRRTSFASMFHHQQLVISTTNITLGIANVGLRTILSLKTSTSRARECYLHSLTQLLMFLCWNHLLQWISISRRHKKALADSLTEMKRKSIKDAKTEDKRVDAIRWQFQYVDHASQWRQTIAGKWKRLRSKITETKTCTPQETLQPRYDYDLGIIK